MKRHQHPQLPDCDPVLLKFKDVPCVNGDGNSLAMCKSCAGSGTVCKGEKKEPAKSADIPPHTVYTNFTGADRPKYARQGYSIECSRCSRCRGAGLVVEAKP